MPLSLTPEQAEELRRALADFDASKQAPQQQTQQQPQAARFKVTLPDGSEFEGTNEEINGAFQRFAASQQQAPPQQGTQVEQRQQFSQDTFKQKFVGDAGEGIDYLFQTKYGYNLGQALPVIAQTLVNLSGKLEELDRGQFQSQVGISAEDYKKIQKAVQDRGWANSRQSYTDAYELLKAKGEIGQAPKTQVSQQIPQQASNFPPGVHFNNQGQTFDQFPQANQNSFIPPQVGSSSGGGSLSPQVPFDIEKRLDTMSTEDIRLMVEQLERQAANGGYQ